MGLRERAPSTRLSRAPKAFTIIEVIVVIIIIAILAVVAIVAFNTFVANANRSAAEQTANSVARVIQAQSGLDQLPPAPMSAARAPSGAQLAFATLTYGADLTEDTVSFQVAGSRALSVVTGGGFLCSGGNIH